MILSSKSESFELYEDRLTSAPRGYAKDHPMIERYNELLKKRTGKDPSGFTAAGGVDEMMALVGEFRDAGVEKFILRPIARGTDEMIEQTRLFIEKLMPEIAALNA